MRSMGTVWFSESVSEPVSELREAGRGSRSYGLVVGEEAIKRLVV